MKQQCIYLGEEDIMLLKQIKEEQGCRTYSQAVSWALKNSQENNARLAKAVRQELEENYMSKERLKWSTQTAEQNSIIILDAINTLLWAFDAGGCVSVEALPHETVKQSRESLKKKIAYFKQKSDERKSKMGID